MILAACRADDPRGTIGAGTRRSRDFVFVFATLFSAGAIIVAGWFANIFDASVLLFGRVGLLLVTRRWFLKQASFSASRFFFKETAAMVLPLLLILVAIDRIKLRDAIRIAIPTIAIASSTSVCAASSFRSGRVDTHQFSLSMLLPTGRDSSESYWRETLWGSRASSATSFRLLDRRHAHMACARGVRRVFRRGGRPVPLHVRGVSGTGLIHYLMFVRGSTSSPGHAHALRVRGRIVAGGPWRFSRSRCSWRDRTYTRYERFQRSYAISIATRRQRRAGDDRLTPEALHDPRRASKSAISPTRR